jgi:hydrogenase maturation protease
VRDALPAPEPGSALSTLVVGVGSPFGDDRVGWEVVQALEAPLQDAPDLRARVRTLACDRPGAGLVGLLGAAAHVIIVDAVRDAGLAPGTMGWLDAVAGQAASTSTHAFGVAEALALAEALGQSPARVEILAIAGEQFAAGAMSEAVRAAVPVAAGMVVARLQKDLRVAAGRR